MRIARLLRFFRLSRASVLPAAILLLLTCARARAQEVALLVDRATSTNIELPSPSGFGLAATADVHGWLFRGTVVRYTDWNGEDAAQCHVMGTPPLTVCTHQDVETRTVLHGVRLTVLRRVRLPGRIRVGVCADRAGNGRRKPYCGDAHFRELSLGLAWDFRGR